MTTRHYRWLTPVLALALLPSTALAEDAPAEVQGTVVSVRGSILAVRPNLRHVMTRVSFDDKTVIMGFERASLAVMRPGERIYMGGRYSKEKGFEARWVEFADKPTGYMAEKHIGFGQQPGSDRATAGGTLKSLQPLVVVDDAGTAFQPDVSHIFGAWHDYQGDRNDILIGTRIEARGRRASDGVIQATSITPNRDFSHVGTMFGTVISATADGLVIQPRFTTDRVKVAYAPTCTFQKQHAVDPDSVKVGDTVTFWGDQHNHPGDMPQTEDLKAVALLIGEGRYPPSSDPHGPVYMTGRITALDPDVHIQLTSGKQLHVLIPAQLVTARLVPIPRSGIKPDTQGMFVLKRSASGGFTASSIILDAPPWVGYGE